MARVVDAGVARRLHEAAALVAKQRVDRIRRTFVPWERGAVDEVNVQVLSPSKSTKATPERFDYALAPGEVLARDLTEGAPREGEPGTPGKLTVQVHSPDSRLQPSRMDIPGPPGDESEE